MLFRFVDCIVHRVRRANAIAFAMKRSSYIENKTKSGESANAIYRSKELTLSPHPFFILKFPYFRI